MAELRQVRILAGSLELEGLLELPDRPQGIVLFAHGAGSNRFSTRNAAVAKALVERGIGALRYDLLTPEELELDRRDPGGLRDVGLLARRLVDALDWLGRLPDTRALRVGVFGAGTGAAAALVAEPERPGRVAAIVCRGGRTDLAGDVVERVSAPVLFVAGGSDPVVRDLNREALDRLRNAHSRLALVPSAGHLFEEPGALAMVARLAADWFERWLGHESDERAPAPGFRPPPYA